MAAGRLARPHSMNALHPLACRILVVDDIARCRELLRAVLEPLGHHIIEAAGGEEALLMLQEQVPHLILLDLKIPAPDGYELLRKIRSDVRWASVPVAALTAEAMLGEREKALSAGFDVYLTKPLGLAAIRKQVQDLLRQSLAR